MFKTIMVAIGITAIVLLAIPAIIGLVAGVVGFLIALGPIWIVSLALLIPGIIIGVIVGKKSK